MVTGMIGCALALQCIALWCLWRFMRGTTRQWEWGGIVLALGLMTVQHGMTLGATFWSASWMLQNVGFLELGTTLCLVVGLQQLGSRWTTWQGVQKRLEESEARYLSVIESSIQGTLIHQNGVIRVANQAVADMFGYHHAAALTGQTIAILIAPHDVDRVQAYPATCQRTTAAPTRYEAQGRRQDNAVVWLEILASLWVWDNQSAVLLTLLDITARKEAEAALATRMQQLDTIRTVANEITQELELMTLLRVITQRAVELVGASVGGIYLWDKATQTLIPKVRHGFPEHSEATVLQLGEGLVGTAAARRQGLLTTHYQHLPYAIPRLIAEFGTMAALAEPLLYRGELVGVLATGRRADKVPFTTADLEALALLATQAAIAIENAQLFRAVKVQTEALEASNCALHGEILERQRIEEERERLIHDLEARNTEMERFTYTVSHDLKSPLITIQGFLNLLEQDISAGQSERIAHDFGFLRSATESMRGLLDDLLELSRIGRVVHPLHPVALEKLVRDALDLVAGRLVAHRVQVDIATELPIVFGDRYRLVQVLQNLFDNAIKFMGEQAAPRIVVGAHQDATEIVCYVRDNGMGIEPRYHDKIFELFQRLEASEEGTGIGLTLVKRIIEIHGGRVWVESAGHNRGSTFYFSLPQHQEHKTT